MKLKLYTRVYMFHGSPKKSPIDLTTGTMFLFRALTSQYPLYTIWKLSQNYIKKI